MGWAGGLASGVGVQTEGPRRGRYGWSGGQGTDFFVDTDGTIGILFAQVGLGVSAAKSVLTAGGAASGSMRDAFGPPRRLPPSTLRHRRVGRRRAASEAAFVNSAA